MTGPAGRGDPTRRFSDRVGHYVRHRPSYPEAVIRHLRREEGLRPGQAVVDLGSGTGLLSELFLRNGHPVVGVEPDRAMREAAEEALEGVEAFRSVAGRAEATGLPDASADWVVAGQAFHWFEPAEAARESARVLRPGGRAALVWNLRWRGGTPFLDTYETFLHRWGVDYDAVSESYADPQSLALFFEGRRWRSAVFPNRQLLDRRGLRGRFLSCSYVPGPDDPRRQEALEALDDLFDRHAREGVVRFEYDTALFVGQPDPRARGRERRDSGE